MLRNKATFEKILEELRSNPTVTIACKKVGISKASLYRWIKEDPVFRQQFEEAQQEGRGDISDIAESFLVSEVKKGNMAAIKHWQAHNDPRYSRRAQNVQIVDEHPSPTTLKKIGQFFGIAHYD